MNEPLVEHKQRRPVMNSPQEPFQAGPRTRTEDYRYALEQALLYRRPMAVMIDEAQHMAKMASGRRLLDQLDVIKSIANRTGTVHVLFTTIFQAHLPNPDKPPLFIDLAARKVGDQLIIDSKLTERLRSSFLLETMIPQYADNLKSLRGLKFDWGRNDLNQDHVYSNQAFTHKLNEFGIAHEAEEYNGTWGEGNWGEAGRVSTEVLPFFSRHLVFDKN